MVREADPRRGDEPSAVVAVERGRDHVETRNHGADQGAAATLIVEIDAPASVLALNRPGFTGGDLVGLRRPC